MVGEIVILGVVPVVAVVVGSAEPTRVRWGRACIAGIERLAGLRHIYNQSPKSTHLSSLLLLPQRLPERGDGDTLFVSLTHAYDTLDDAMKDRIKGLRAGCDVAKNVKPEYIYTSDQKKQLESMPQVVRRRGGEVATWRLVVCGGGGEEKEQR